MVIAREVPERPYDPITCEDCDVVMRLMVCFSPAGYYLGHMCNCGPYGRYTEYYKCHHEVIKDLNTGMAKWRR